MCSRCSTSRRDHLCDGVLSDAWLDSTPGNPDCSMQISNNPRNSSNSRRPGRPACSGVPPAGLSNSDNTPNDVPLPMQPMARPSPLTPQSEMEHCLCRNPYIECGFALHPVRSVLTRHRDRDYDVEWTRWFSSCFISRLEHFH